jgi:hypothetical protein
MSPSDRVTQFYLQAPGSFSIAFYDSSGYGGIILNRLPRKKYTITSSYILNIYLIFE